MRFQPRLLPTLLLSVAALAAAPNRLDKLKEGQGVLILKWVGVQPVSQQNPRWHTLKLVSKATGQLIDIQDTAPVQSGCSFFVGPLPAGSYELMELDAAGAAPMNFGLLPGLLISAAGSDRLELVSKLGTFTVKAGGLTNLGLVACALTGDKAQPAKWAKLSDAEGRASAFEELDAAEQAKVAALGVQAWDKPAEGGLAQGSELVRAYARNVSPMDLAPDGRVLLGSALGLVHIRETDGAWTTLATGSLDSISCVRALEGGRIFAGTDTGRYLLWSPEEKRWTAYDLGLRGFKATQLEPMGEKGFAIVGLLADGRTQVNKILFKAKLEDAAAPSELLKVDGFSAMGVFPVLYDGQSLLAVFNHAGMSRTADLYRLDPAGGDRKAEELDHWVHRFYRLPTGELARERMNGLYTYTDLSKDNGKTWMKDPSSGEWSSCYLGAMTGFAFRIKSHGWSANNLILIKTTDGGKNWSDAGTVIRGEGTMDVRAAQGRIFVNTPAKLLSTADEGKTWRTEWPLSPRSDKD